MTVLIVISTRDSDPDWGKKIKTYVYGVDAMTVLIVTSTRDSDPDWGKRIKKIWELKRLMSMVQKKKGKRKLEILEKLENTVRLHNTTPLNTHLCI
jgi:hypothetical protein